MRAIAPDFYVHLSRMKKKRETCSLGFDVSYTERADVHQFMLGLFYTGDIVLSANKRVELQKLTNLWGEERYYLCLKLSCDKSV